MVQYHTSTVGDCFTALADDTRRGVLEHLVHDDWSITDLAAAFHMTLTGMGKHVRILEQAGLVATEKVGRVRYCRLGQSHLDEAAAWIEEYQRLWDARFRQLDTVLENLQGREMHDGHTNE